MVTPPILAYNLTPLCLNGALEVWISWMLPWETYHSRHTSPPPPPTCSHPLLEVKVCLNLYSPPVDLLEKVLDGCSRLVPDLFYQDNVVPSYDLKPRHCHGLPTYWLDFYMVLYGQMVLNWILLAFNEYIVCIPAYILVLRYTHFICLF